MTTVMAASKHAAAAAADNFSSKDDSTHPTPSPPFFFYSVRRKQQAGAAAIRRRAICIQHLAVQTQCSRLIKGSGGNKYLSAVRLLLGGLNGGELWRPMITQSREAERIIGGFVLGEINTDMGGRQAGGGGCSH